jgi:asparagine synthase (glutamine-hydrolysing)
VQSPGTIYEKIHTFPAGTAKWVDGAPTAAPARRFWSFPSRQLSGIDERSAAAEIRGMIHDSVLRHLVADVPVGVFLSAGIDSTIIASFAREYTPQVTAFTVGFGGLTTDDETEIAAKTAAALGVKHVALQVDPTNLPDSWNDWMTGAEPFCSDDLKLVVSMMTPPA